MNGKYQFAGIVWTARTKTIAKYIKDDTNVLDLGGGVEHLKEFIKPKKYISVDYCKVKPSTVVANLNLKLPDFETRFHYVVCQGVLEYLDDVPGVLKGIKKYAKTLLVTYFDRSRKHRAWVNNYTFWEFEQILKEAGWYIKKKEQVMDGGQALYYCTQTPPKKILFAGASGYKNIGDDGYKQVFEKHLGLNYELYFDSPYPDMRYFEEGIDHVVIGGGGLLYDNKTEHFNYMKMYLDEAIKRNIDFSFISCGVQIVNYSIKLPEEKVLEIGIKELQRWKPYLDKAKVITVRSEMDRKIIKGVCPESNVHYVPDLCYLLMPCDRHLTLPNSAVFILTKLSLKGNGDKFRELWDKYKCYGNRRYVIAMAQDDEDITEEYANKIQAGGHYSIRTSLTPTEVARIIRDADKVISARYHGHVLARACGKAEEDIDVIDLRYKSMVEQKPDRLTDAKENIILLTQAINGRL